MSIWADIHRRSNGTAVRKEDTVTNKLDLDWNQYKNMFVNVPSVTTFIHSDATPIKKIQEDIKVLKKSNKELQKRLREIKKYGL